MYAFKPTYREDIMLLLAEAGNLPVF